MTQARRCGSRSAPIDLPGAAPAREFHDTPEARRERREKLLHGRTVQIDTAFPYYHNRSNESIASELRVNGFDGVYYYTGTDTGSAPGWSARCSARNSASD